MRFPVEDITHKPRRRQGDNIKTNSVTYAGDYSPSHQDPSFADVPETLTPERLVKFYEENVDGSKLGEVYSVTAKYLRQFIDRSMKKGDHVEDGAAQSSSRLGEGGLSESGNTVSFSDVGWGNKDRE